MFFFIVFEMIEGMMVNFMLGLLYVVFVIVGIAFINMLFFVYLGVIFKLINSKFGFMLCDCLFLWCFIMVICVLIVLW